MIIRIVFSVLSFLACHNLYAAGTACFNYEIYEHLAAGAALNTAIVHYDYALIRARNLAIPPLAPIPPGGAGVHQIEVSNMSSVVAAPAWQHVPALLGGDLTLQEGCIMAVTRPHIGIKIEFQNLAAIAAVAAGGGGGAYVATALARGGYKHPLAASIYRLRTNPVPPNFIALPGGGVADCVIIHFHIPVRVSKNLKELSYNAVINPAVGIVPYLSIKSIIDNQFAMAGIPAPHSATVVSADSLQRRSA